MKKVEQRKTMWQSNRNNYLFNFIHIIYLLTTYSLWNAKKQLFVLFKHKWTAHLLQEIKEKPLQPGYLHLCRISFCWGQWDVWSLRISCSGNVHAGPLFFFAWSYPSSDDDGLPLDNLMPPVCTKECAICPLKSIKRVRFLLPFSTSTSLYSTQALTAVRSRKW